MNTNSSTQTTTPILTLARPVNWGGWAALRRIENTQGFGIDIRDFVASNVVASGQVCARGKLYLNVNKFFALFTAKCAKNAKHERFLWLIFAPACRIKFACICVNLRLNKADISSFLRKHRRLKKCHELEAGLLRSQADSEKLMEAVVGRMLAE